MSSGAISTNKACLFFGLWVVTMLAVLAVLLVAVRGGAKLETNILSLLPSLNNNPSVVDAVSSFDDVLGKKHVVLIGGDNKTQARLAADDFYSGSLKSELFSAIQYEVSQADVASAYAFYADFKSQLLSRYMRPKIESGGVAASIAEARKKLYGPASVVNSALLADDPLLLFFDFMTRLSPNESHLHIDGSRLVAEYDHRYYIMIVLDLQGSPYSLTVQDQVVPFIDAQRQLLLQTYPNLDVLSVGAVNYAKAGVDSAKREIRNIGMVSAMGILALLLVAFRSVRPIALSLLAIASGFLAAFAACLSIFGSIHVLTLVFGASLIGIAVDYSFHYFADRQLGGENWTPAKGVGRIYNGISMGLITSVIGFLGLCFAPFPGMQQMAVFSIAGLIVAYITVLWLFPVTAATTVREQPSLRLYIDAVFKQWNRVLSMLSRLPVVLAMAVVVSYGVMQLEFNDDVKALQSLPNSLIASEAKVKAVTGVNASVNYFVVQAQSAELVLQKEERLIVRLDELQLRGEISGFDAVSKFVPSRASQARNSALMMRATSEDRGALVQYFEEIGLPVSYLDRLNILSNLSDAPRLTSYLNIEQWLAHPISASYRHLWVGSGLGHLGGNTDRSESSQIQADGLKKKYTSIVVPRGVRDIDQLVSLANTDEQVYWIDRADAVSQLFKEYRQRAGGLVAIAYAFIFLLLWIKYRLANTVRIFLSPCVAAIILIALLGIIGEPMNLFHVLALLLVLGIGIDYTLFLHEGVGHERSTLLAVVLSALTSLLTFGVLTLSEIAAIHAFGLTILVGICCALILSPIVIQPRNTKEI